LDFFFFFYFFFSVFIREDYERLGDTSWLFQKDNDTNVTYVFDYEGIVLNSVLFYVDHINPVELLDKWQIKNYNIKLENNKIIRDVTKNQLLKIYNLDKEQTNLFLKKRDAFFKRNKKFIEDKNINTNKKDDLNNNNQEEEKDIE
jgi:ABC-type transporter lipoprotein component MlaA